MREHVEVAVVGGGIMGTCAAWRLAAAGRDVILLERFAFGHDRGSSHGPTRVFRFAYDDPAYVRMAMASLPLWRELGAGLIRFTGGIDAGDPRRIQATHDALTASGAHAEMLDETELRRRAPWLGAVDAPALFSPDTGVIAAAAALEAARDAARASGAHLMESTHVTTIEPDDHGVTLSTPGGTIRAERCILAAGAWTQPLLASVGIPIELRVTKESLFYYEGDLPLVVICWQDVPWYAVPAFDRSVNPKMGYHGARHVIDPDSGSREPDAELGRRLSEIVRDGITVLRPEPLRAETCLYTNTADDAFVLDVRGPLVIASPCSGHGFKFAPLIGETLACLATGRTPPVDLAAFRLDR